MKKTILALCALVMAGMTQAQMIKQVTAFSSEITTMNIDTLRAYKTTDADYLVTLNELKDLFEKDLSVDLKKEKSIMKSEQNYLKNQQKNYKTSKKHLDEQKKFYKTEIKNCEKEVKALTKQQKEAVKAGAGPETTQMLEERISRSRQEITNSKEKLTKLNTVETERLKKWQLGLAGFANELKTKELRIKGYESSVKTNLSIIKNEIKATEAAMKGK